MLSRFSKTIPFALALLVAAGLLLAVVQLDHISALWTTDYGRIFLLKCMALLMLFALAGLNRGVLTPAFLHGDAKNRLPRSIAAEAVIVLAILGVVGLWRFAPPPRALAVAAKTPFFTHIHAANAMADVTINPGNVGPVGATIVLHKPEDETPLEAKAVTLTLSNGGSQRSPLTRQATRAGDGSWRVEDLTIPQAGRWQIEVDVRVGDDNNAALTASIEIKP